VTATPDGLGRHTRPRGSAPRGRRRREPTGSRRRGTTRSASRAARAEHDQQDPEHSTTDVRTNHPAGL